MAREVAGRDTFAKLLFDQAALRGDASAIREKRRGIWGNITFRMLSDEAAHLSLALAERGIARGERVAVIGDNRPRLFGAIAATHALGGVAVPLYPDSSAEEVAGQLRAARVSAVFAEDQEQVDKVLDILPNCPGVRLVVYDDDRGMRHYVHPGLADHGHLIDEGQALAAKAPDAYRQAVAAGQGSDEAFVFFTSGASGAPKGVVFTHAALIGRTRAAVQAQGLTASDTTLAFFPPGWLCQTMFSYMSSMVAGLCICCPESLETLIDDMREIAPTSLLTTPRMLDAIFSRISTRMEETGGINLVLYRRALALAQRVGRQRMEGYAPGAVNRFGMAAYGALIYAPLRDILGMSRLRSACSTGDTLDPAMQGFFQTLGIDLRQVYGATETAFFVAMQRHGDEGRGTVGKPLDDIAVRISDRGEIEVRSDGLMAGYLDDPSAMAAVRSADGWLRTGDAGILEPDGNLRLVDRMDAIGRLADGTVFAPRMLESRIRFSPHIRDAVVVGDGRDGICALVDIDTLAVGRWADDHAIAYMGHADLASQDEVYGLVADWIAEVNAGLARDPATAALQIRRFALVPEELGTENGFLTPTGKVRRHAVTERFAALIEGLYAGQSEVMLETAAVEEGHHGPVALKIREASVVGVPGSRRAA
ncbi:AMP-dependent synthetase/ligase [Rhodovulum euryhalinum]|uniref:Long-chain acyl-CoA synthetase n=1 Tax=Rhodovulum euryhalinum TaxID=35805 RepID=A0A4R2KXB3_9RHOB|nr:AMP-binding protein [Rhodovulum euryhalinum]TCO71325.1 long-chain acyl-CoA synthetase [Rhodovulum euryhalinum]